MRDKKVKRLRKITERYFEQNQHKATHKIMRLFYKGLKRQLNKTPKPKRGEFLRILELGNEFTS